MSPAKKKPNTEDYLRMYRQMVRIRAFEDNANQLYLSAKMPGLTHMYSGEEAVAVGICEALTDDDKITSTHRGPRPLRRQGRRVQADVLRAAGQGGGLLPRQGRVDAYRRPEPRQPRRQCHRRRLDGHRHRRRLLRQAAGQAGRHRLLLRRRRHGAGPVVRGDEHGGAVEAAGDLRLREQRLFRIHQDRRDRRGVDHRPGRGVRHRGPQGRRAGRAGGQRR